MTPKRMLLPLLICALFLSMVSTVSAQDATTEPVPLPADWRERSGIEMGLQIRDIAQQEGTPFDASMLDVRQRPGIGLDVVRRGRNILILEDNDGSIRRASFGGQSAWQQVLRSVYSLYPDRFDMVMALTEWQERSAFAYYLPLANDTRGIGYLHLSGRDIFNQTGSNLDGLIFMNDYRTYLGRNAVFGRIVFLQEIGHRWGSFVFYGNGPGNGRDMLGRDQSHWSYFMQTENSAMEGNDWRDNGNGSFSTRTNAFALGFSDLDLYLMGFKPTSQVQDWFLIRNPDVRGQRDDFGQTINAASGPAISDRVTINGSRQAITIDDVITAEGQRQPGFDTSQKVWTIATVLILNQGSAANWDDRDQATVEGLIDDWEEMFEAETGGVADLVTTLEDSPPPADRGFGDSCTSTSQCDSATSTVCLTTDSGRICSKSCRNTDECGPGFCCGEGACFPAGDSVCATDLPEECTSDSQCGFGCCIDGQCADGAACGGNNDANNDPNNDPNNEECQEGGFVTDCGNNGDGGFVGEGDGFLPGSGSGSGSGNALCQAAPGSAPAGLPVGLALMALMLTGVLVTRRR